MMAVVRGRPNSIVWSDLHVSELTVVWVDGGGVVPYLYSVE